jgi:hypothetical protein
MFICPYCLWNRTILVQNVALSITCLHLHNTSCITFIDNDHWFIESTPHNFSMWYIILSSYTHSCEALYNTMLEWLKELTIKCLFKDYYKMVFLYWCKAYLDDLKFGDLINNQNHYIHINGSWITPRPHVLFEISKDILNFNPPTFGRSSAATR